MKIEEIKNLRVKGASMLQEVVCEYPDDLNPVFWFRVGFDFDTADECLQVAALFRAAPTMLEALKAAVAYDDALVSAYTIHIQEQGGGPVINRPPWYEKVKQAIEMAENTNERL